jgi:hypothetical protein
MHRVKFALSFLLLLIGACFPLFGATAAYSFSGVASDGLTVKFNFTLPAPVPGATVLTAAQVQCAPACDAIGLFPGALAGYDLVVVDVHNPSGSPTSVPFYFPAGSLANPGVYSTAAVSGITTSGSLTVQVTGVPYITSPGSLANGSVGVGYFASFTASGGTAPYTFTNDSGTLPPGLTLSTSGLLSGTPATGGTYTFSVRVADSASAFSSRTYTVSFATGVNIATTSLPNGALGVAYSQALTATGGTGPYTWSVTSGSLPPGMMLSPAGQITGTPTLGGGFGFTVRATDSASASATANLSITVSSLVTITTPSPLPSGAVNAPYSVNLEAVGGTQPYTWTQISGTLPSGLTLAANGALSGTPAASTNAFFDLRVTDAVGASAIRSYQLYIGVGVTIDASQLPNPTVGVAYSKALSAAGGTAPYTWSVIGGALPPGLALSTSGVLSGTPTTPGVFFVTVRAADSASGANFATFTITVLPAVTITTASPLPNGSPGIAYSVTLAATGGAAPYTWAVASGNLPPGLSLSTSGAITGTPTSGGTYSFVIRATDSSTAYSLQAYTITIGAALVITTPATLPNANVGVQYAQTLAASGGTAPYTWTVATGSVPPGLALSTAGALTGTPTQGGSYSFVARVTDAMGLSNIQTFTLTVGTGLAITTPPALPNGAPGVPYSQTLAAVGGAPPYTWLIVGGAPPPGLTLTTAGVLSGTPSATGNYTFQVRVTDNAAANTTQTFTLNIGTGLTITTGTTLPNAVIGQPYTQTFLAVGGTQPYIWTLAGGQVPPGLNLVTNGTLSGTPSTQGTYLFTVRVTDNGGLGNSVTQTYSLTVATGLTITTASPLPNGQVGVVYLQTLAVAGGVAPYTWSLASGTLAPGLTVTNNGGITGTPTTAGSYTFGVRVIDNTGANATAQFTLTIGSGMTITTATLPNGAIGVQYSQTLAAAGGTAPFTWSLSAGTLPPGLTISNSGVLSGTPNFIGQFTFTIRVTDSASLTAERAFTLTIAQAVTITTPSPLAGGIAGSFYNQQLQATGGVTPYVWSVSAGSLPQGLTLNPNGSITGTPTIGGAYNFTARVTDSVSTSATQAFQLTIVAGVIITTTSPLPEAAVGSSYFLTFGGSGGAGPYNWQVVSGALPPGMQLSGGGALTGVPAVAGTFNFTVRLTDAAQAATQSAFTLVVSSGGIYPRSGVISQIASGGGWRTTITLINISQSQAQVRVNLFADDGTPLQLPVTVTLGNSGITTVAASIDRTIPAGGTLLIDSETALSTTSVGWADVRSSATLAGFAIFRQKHGSGVDSEGTSPLEPRNASSVIIPMDNLIGFSTGVALVNLSSDTQATVTAILRDDSGNELSRDTVAIAPNGHTSFSLPDRFTVVKGRRGFVEFQTNLPAGLAGLGLRFNPTLSFTSVPAITR